MSETRQLPSCFHIGTQKAGSTLLYNLLKSHPDVSLSTHTEVNYYSSSFSKGEDWYLDGFQGEGVRIDTSPKYFMLGHEVAPRISDVIGADAKFLLILRNPIDYLNSHYQMHRTHRYFERHPEKYPEVPDTLVEFVNRYPEYLERAYYFKLLNVEWLRHFSLEQFKVVFFEDLISNRNQVLSDILQFFDLPQIQLESTDVSKNKMLRTPRLLALQNVVIKHPKLKEKLKSSKLFSAFYDRILTKDSRGSLTPGERAHLKAIYNEDVERFQELLGRDLSVWKDFIV